MVRLNRIYTKAGDGGHTRLVGGQKVPKNASRIEAYGTVDELMASLGVVRAALAAPGAPAGAAELEAIVRRMQNELFNLGSFILPGGGLAAAHLHVARTVCRRAERLVVGLMMAGEPVEAQVLPYLNRLSDALFVMSRHASRLYGEAEPLWEPEKT